MPSFLNQHFREWRGFILNNFALPLLFLQLPAPITFLLSSSAELLLGSRSAYQTQGSDFLLSSSDTFQPLGLLPASLSICSGPACNS